ncbi:MAG: biotin transporter BioY [Calditrichaeota bacterium]|nr:MAG: biotin transporter BioY [Calditrichota bacterium]
MVTAAIIFRPGEPLLALFYDLMLVGFGSLFLGLCSQISFHLPGNPVPVTGQTLAILLVGTALGSVRGALAVALYLVEGALGFPVFAGGKSGMMVLLGPSGGYLLGFLPASFLAGWLAERGWDRKPWTTALAMTLAYVPIYLFGMLGLIPFVPLSKVFQVGVMPFLPGALLKIGLASALLPSAWKALQWLGFVHGSGGADLTDSGQKG